MSDPITTTQMIAAITGSGVAISGAIYAALRKIKTDDTADKVDIKTQALLDNINAQLESERAENKALRDAVERVATERNEAVQTVGKMEGHVTALEREVASLSAQVQSLKDENKLLTAEIHEMRKQLQQALHLFAPNTFSAQ